MNSTFNGARDLRDYWKYVLPGLRKKAKKNGDFVVPEDAQPSELGLKVATIVGEAFRGIHHIRDAVYATDWSNDRYIRMPNIKRDLSTFDSDELTILVVLCHDAAVRLEISAHTFNSIELTFHQRKREGGWSERHPEMESSVARVRQYFGLVEEVPDV